MKSFNQRGTCDHTPTLHFKYAVPLNSLNNLQFSEEKKKTSERLSYLTGGTQAVVSGPVNR